MINLGINLNDDGALKGLKIKEVTFAEVLVLDKGMTSGRPSVALHFESEGEHYVAQTSARLFCATTRILLGKYPDLFDGK